MEQVTITHYLLLYPSTSSSYILLKFNTLLWKGPPSLQVKTAKFLLRGEISLSVKDERVDLRNSHEKLAPRAEVMNNNELRSPSLKDDM